MTLKEKTILFALALCGLFAMLQMVWSMLTSISYDKPRKSPITKKHKQLFKPLL